MTGRPSYEAEKWYQKGRTDALEELYREMYRQTFNVSHEEDGLQKWDSGCWIRFKLFENVTKKVFVS